MFLPLSALERRPRRIGLAWAPSDTWPKSQTGAIWGARVAKAWHPFSLGLKLIVGTKAESVGVPRAGGCLELLENHTRHELRLGLCG